MAETLDAASRLTEGVPSVENIQNYVCACRALGYQDPELTLHASQVRDWYATEDGLDLRALDADCAALQAVAAAAEDALARQSEQLAALSAAWQGRGADASREFLRGHGDTAAGATAAVRTAAYALADLRDNLWRAVDTKVDAALAIDDRVQAQRAEWLAAAQTVTTGAGDLSTASELIDQQVKPFVDNDIRADWLTAMRAAIAAIEAAYDAAAAELASGNGATFDVPGDLGPAWTPAAQHDVIATTPAAVGVGPAPDASAPPVWSAPPAGAPPAAAPLATPAAPPPPTPPPMDPAAMAPAMATPPAMPSMGGMGGMPDIGSGLSGFGQQIADTLSGLLGSAEGGLPEPAELEEPDEPEEPEDFEEPDDAIEDDEAEEDVEPVDEKSDVCERPAEEPVAEPLAGEAVEPPVEPAPPPEPAPTPAPLPPPPEPLPPPAPMATTETPCEIAADDLPQVGE